MAQSRVQIQSIIHALIEEYLNYREKTWANAFKGLSREAERSKDCKDLLTRVETLKLDDPKDIIDLANRFGKLSRKAQSEKAPENQSWIKNWTLSYFTDENSACARMADAAKAALISHVSNDPQLHEAFTAEIAKIKTEKAQIEVKMRANLRRKVSVQEHEEPKQRLFLMLIDAFDQETIENCAIDKALFPTPIIPADFEKIKKFEALKSLKLSTDIPLCYQLDFIHIYFHQDIHSDPKRELCFRTSVQKKGPVGNVTMFGGVTGLDILRPDYYVDVLATPPSTPAPGNKAAAAPQGAAPAAQGEKPNPPVGPAPLSNPSEKSDASPGAHAGSSASPVAALGVGMFANNGGKAKAKPKTAADSNGQAPANQGSEPPRPNA